MNSKKYTILEPASFKLDGGAMFGIIPRPLWNKVHPSDESNRIDLALRLLLIEEGEKKILIDTGIGDYHGMKFDERFGVSQPVHPLNEVLKTMGLNPDDITDLIVSHLHFDHVGGLTQIENDQKCPVFKNATLHLHKDHYAYSLNPTDRDSGSFHREYFEPVINYYIEKKKINWLSGMEGTILDSLKFKCSMGHTPFLVHPYDEKFIYLADLIPTSNHVSIPWVMGYDISPGITTKDKKEFLKFIFENNLLAIYEHDPKFYASTLKKDSHGNFVCDDHFQREKIKQYKIIN